MSAFLEIKLQEHLALIEGKQSFYHNSNNIDKNKTSNICGCRDLNPSYKLGNRVSTGEKQRISNDVFNKFLTLRELEGLSKKWHYQGKLCLNKYLNFVNWKINESKTLEYYQSLKNNLSISYYKKEVYQIRKFLTYLKVEWANDIKLPPDPIYLPKRVAIDDINKSLDYFKDNKFYLQAKALILLGMSSGARALELYQLTFEDIDIENRVLHINHNPQNGQSTKTKMSRISFFTEEAIRNSSIKVKDLRKYFSQEWDRRGGPTSIKKILMGHSLRGDVDLMHYNCQSEEDLTVNLKRILKRYTIE